MITDLSTQHAPLAATELAELALSSRQVQRWRLAILSHHPSLDEDALFTTCCEALWRRATLARNLPLTTTELPEPPALSPLLDAIDTDTLREPHLLGWLLQAFQSPARHTSATAHTRHDHKHPTATITTQLYTPRWIADFMIQRALAITTPHLSPDTPPSICDPAVGSGQLLLASLDLLVAHYPLASPYAIAQSLHGVDLEPRAVAIARRLLHARLIEHFGPTPNLDTLLLHTLTVADGLARPSQRFDITLSNPPYMGARGMPPGLRGELLARWKPFHTDLYVAFMRRCVELSRHATALLTPQTIWYLSRFEPARRWLLRHAPIVDFAHLGAGVFTALSGEVASVVACVLDTQQQDRDPTPDKEAPRHARFYDVRGLPDVHTQRLRLIELLANTLPRPLAPIVALPGAPIAHALPEPLRRAILHNAHLDTIALIPGSQNKTGDNARFVKPWQEVDPATIHPAERLFEPPSFDADADAGTTQTPQPRWAFYSKGGRYAPWWGGWSTVVDWSPEARDFYRHNKNSTLLAPAYWQRPGLCYTDFGGERFNARWMPRGCLFDMAGPAIFAPAHLPPAAEERRLLAILAILNASTSSAILNALNPSLHYQVRDVRALPLPPGWDDALEAELADLASPLIELTRALHLALPDDPLGCLAPDNREVRDRAQQLIDAIGERWQRLDLHICALYDYTPSPYTPRPAHHITRLFF